MDSAGSGQGEVQGMTHPGSVECEACLDQLENQQLPKKKSQLYGQFTEQHRVKLPTQGRGKVTLCVLHYMSMLDVELFLQPQLVACLIEQWYSTWGTRT